MYCTDTKKWNLIFLIIRSLWQKITHNILPDVLSTRLSEILAIGYSFVYSIKSPGWQSNAWHSDSSVLNRIAFAFPVLSMERLASVKSTFSESSFKDILRLAIITSKFTIIGIVKRLNRFRFGFQFPF